MPQDTFPFIQLAMLAPSVRRLGLFSGAMHDVESLGEKYKQQPPSFDEQRAYFRAKRRLLCHNPIYNNILNCDWFKSLFHLIDARSRG